MQQQKLKIDNNTCIISSCLINELDYVVGGYGKPTVESLFNLNAFIEAYVLSSHFLITRQELDHINITSKVLFPAGRPIFELIQSTKNLSVIDGLGNKLMICVYVNQVDEHSQTAIASSISDFQSRDSKKIRSTFILSDLSKVVKSVQTFVLAFNKNQIAICETWTKPFEIVREFYDSVSNYNVQSALPIFTYEQQFNALHKKAISKDIFRTICEIKGQEIAEAEHFIGGEIQALPPLVSIVLSKVKNREEIPRAIKEIREDFTDFRICCEKYEESLNNADTIKEQLEAIKEYKIFWATLVKKYADKSSRIVFRFLDIAKESNYEASVDNFIDTQNASEILKDLNLGKVAGKAGIFAWDKIKEKRILNRFKGVVNLWEIVDNAPAIEKQIKNLERIFNVQMDSRSIVKVTNYLKTIEKTSSKVVSR